jgi:hypothetical protein
LAVLYSVIWAIGLFLVVQVPSFPLGWFIVNLAFFQIGLCLSIVPHELGHLFATKLIGLRPFRMIIGRGPTLLSGRFLNVPTQIKVLPFAGRVLAKHTTSDWFRLRKFLFAAAGPIANGLVAFAIWHFGGIGRNVLAVKFFEGLRPLESLFCANVILCLINLWPFTLKTEAGGFASDGKQMLQAPFLKKSEIELAFAKVRAKRKKAGKIGKLI